jgi:DNA polymerase/3'-5' exonuclease PolX
MKIEQAILIAERVKAQLAPYCDRIEIAGSIRRGKADVGDIEIVAIPKPYDVGLFASGIALIVNQWPKVRGELPCKYTQRTLPDGIALDLFFATRENWGLIFAIRTGSADYSHRVLACGWVRAGYKSADGMLTRDGVTVAAPEERDLFRLAGVPWVEPEARNLNFQNAGVTGAELAKRPR